MNVGTNIMGLMYNEKFYTNPEKFDPERWNDKSMITSEPYSFIPFSAGPRSCIGKYLALMESKMILVHFMHSFTVKRTEVPLRMFAKLLYEPIE
jgi:cytochrome P450